MQRHEPAVRDMFAEFVHFLFVDGELDAKQRVVVGELLRYGPRRDLPQRVGAPYCVAMPRPGTVSPWCSKATDIFHRCGLAMVARVERGVRWHFDGTPSQCPESLYDRMTQTVVYGESFGLPATDGARRPLQRIELGAEPGDVLAAANERMGLALSAAEIDYLTRVFGELERDPTDAELMMFAQANSEHCRHKIFNARWRVDDELDTRDSLFDRIRGTSRAVGGMRKGIVSAYKDNAAVVAQVATGSNASTRFLPGADGLYRPHPSQTHLLMKVETHNHPTAISPYPGAATGSGGEIRDEGAVGRGSKPKAGMVGYTTSHLNLGDEAASWEPRTAKPPRIASAQEIMLQAPLGAAAFNNEFGRPCLAGYFRTFEFPSHRPGETWGYHKPVMLAGGVGSVAAELVTADHIPAGVKLVVLGGPAMLIGLGGGAASSMGSGEADAELDFASVQRDNAEMQRRCQEVIDRCTARGIANPIRLIHDVGAGGLANALPELLHEANLGGRIEIRAVPNADRSMSPMEIWCNEAQERYVLAIAAADLPAFEAFCRRERCLYAVVGEATAERRLLVTDAELDETVVDMPMDALFGNTPQQVRRYRTQARPAVPFDHRGIDLGAAIDRVLRFPAVGSKKFLVTIGDRSISGLVARDQMVGRRQVPVADCAVTLHDFHTYRGEAMAMGERAPLGVIDPAAAARMAVAEALTNLFAAPADLSRTVLSANWMGAPGHEGEDEALYDAVSAAAGLCSGLGIAIPVGKDSLSMRTAWQSNTVVSPVTLNVAAFAPLADVRPTLTPDMDANVRWQPRNAGARNTGSAGQTDGLWLIEPAFARQRRLAGSALAQCFGTRATASLPALGEDPPDVGLEGFKKLLELIDRLRGDGFITCYHDRSDGGLLTTLLEMAFATGRGLDIFVGDDAIAELFAEEVGIVVGVDSRCERAVCEAVREAGLHIAEAAAPRDDQRIVVKAGRKELFASTRAELERLWASTSHAMQRRRDDAGCADEEHAAIADDKPLLAYAANYATDVDVAAPYVASGVRPRVAILREQGVNGQLEMAAAFHRAGFDAIDVHMTDLFADPALLGSFQALAICGGFSYGDVLGGGGGWAKSILFENRVYDAFARFFERDTLTLGVCNGCQMLTFLKNMIPGAVHWPRFVANRSECFEARTALLRVAENASPWLADMGGALLPTPVAHGEGRAEFDSGVGFDDLQRAGGVALQYANAAGEPTERYPHNPNGSAQGLAGIAAADGRVLATMPHPERAFRAVQNSWLHASWGEDGPWLRLFRNARVALGARLDAR